MSKGVSDSTLQRYWRKAVLLNHHNTCIICGKKKEDSDLECHHIIYKSQNRPLRHDPKNGVPTCKYGCHKKAHTSIGKKIITDYLGAAHTNYLYKRENWFVKDLRKAMSFSQHEHEKWELARLKEVIAKYQED